VFGLLNLPLSLIGQDSPAIGFMSAIYEETAGLGVFGLLKFSVIFHVLACLWTELHIYFGQVHTKMTVIYQTGAQPQVGREA
jgi:hypothetical protein